MDRESARLANHIKRTVTGPMWHGSALAEVLAGVSHEAAAARPIAGAHGIWEIVLHVTAWAEISRARLRGERIADPSASEDWPSGSSGSAAEWQTAVERLLASHRELAHDVRHLEDAALQTKVAGLEYTVSNLLHGVIEHGTYHGGQIALLKKALAGTSASRS
jgi:uncharacterized damage-inducible protein DinB